MIRLLVRPLGIVVSVISLAVVTGCGAPPGDDASSSGETWPFSAIDAPPPLDSTPAEADDHGDRPGPLGPPALADNGAALPGTPSTNAGTTAGAGNGARRDTTGEPVDRGASRPMTRTSRGVADFPDARFARPEHVRGLYVNAWSAGSTARMNALIDLAERTEINTFVIDIKDASGYLSHETRVPLAHEIGATEERRIRDLPALLDRLEAAGIYPIARIVVVQDPVLSKFRPEYAVQDTAGGIWVDSKNIVWLNPYSRDVWDYHIEIAREVAEMGFPEIQWDYIRFPDASESDLARAVFVGAEERERARIIREFLAHARESLEDLPVRSTADVFGVTTSFRRDVGIGQLWEMFIDVVDVALPMVYPSHYWTGSFGIDRPNAYPYEVVRRALRDAIGRSAAVEGAGMTRPWLQDFTLGEPIYGGAEVRAQIQAAYDAGIEEWILWNPSSRYTESALEPVGGFEREPLMRVAGVLAPVSRRHIVMDSVAALPPPPDTTIGEPLVDSIAVDTLDVDPLTRDTLHLLDSLVGDTLAADSVDVDTLAVDTTAADTLVVDTLAADTLAVDTLAARPLRF